MKKLFCFVLLILQLSIFTSCSATTITEEPGNYQYGINEEIKIIDIDTRDTLGTLTITGFEILKDEPFELKESDGVDENSQTIYKNVTYNQIVQVYYVYSKTGSGKTITDANFTISDSRNEPTIFDPETDYVEVPKEGESSFVIAIKNKSDLLYMNFRYDLLQVKTTAKIKINLNDQSIPDEDSSQNVAETSSDEYTSDTESSTSSQNQSNFELSKYLKYNHLFIITVILLALVIILLVLLIIFRRRK